MGGMLSTSRYEFESSQALLPTEDGFTFTISDNNDEDDIISVTIKPSETQCCPPVFNHMLVDTGVTITIVDDGMFLFFFFLSFFLHLSLRSF